MFTPTITPEGLAQEITCRMPQAGKYKYVILETSDKFTTEAKLDLSDGSVTTIKQSPIQAMKLENVEVDDSDPNHVLDIYICQSFLQT